MLPPDVAARQERELSELAAAHEAERAASGLYDAEVRGSGRPDVPGSGYTTADSELALSILWQLVGVDWPGGRFAKIEGPWLKLREARFHASSPELDLLDRLAVGPEPEN